MFGEQGLLATLAEVNTDPDPWPAPGVTAHVVDTIVRDEGEQRSDDLTMCVRERIPLA
ncbi:MAG: hypothetical protein AAGG38_11820 [Planctomycetota bacterium]